MDRTIKVFISSPSDVRPERIIAERVITRLDREFSHYFRVQPVMWEREPLVASHHFQTNIVAPHETDIVIVILWLRLGVTLPIERFQGPLTGKAVTGTEWEFEDALKAYRESGKPELLVYRKTADKLASLEDDEKLQEMREQKRLLKDFLGRWFWDQESQSFKAAFSEFSETAQFEGMLETHLRALLRKQLEQSDDELGPRAIRWHEGSPFRGLEAFDLRHSQVFFGRTKARNELRELLTRQAERGSAFVLVIGASGSGKSSLVKAGLMADLSLPGMVERVALVRHALFRPSALGSDPFGALAASLVAPQALPELADAGYSANVLVPLLREAPKALRDRLAEALASARHNAALSDIGEARLLIVIDQFEELFTGAAPDYEERDRFVACLEFLAHCGLVWIVATMRSDFFDRLETLPRLLALSSEASYVVAPPDAAEIAQIIREPAKEAGLRFEVELTTGLSLDSLILQAAATDRGALPLLSYVLDQLWHDAQQEKRSLLTFQSYQALGALEGALGQRAEEVFLALPEASQAELPALMRALVTVEADGRAAARPFPLSEIAETGPRRALVDAFLAPNARLLVADRDGAVTLIRVAHEALLTHWRRAAQLVEAERRDLELRARLEQAQRRWHAAPVKSRASLLLAAGLPLREGIDLVQRWAQGLDPAIVAFVRASRVSAIRRQVRLAVMFLLSILALPAAAGLIWTALVWHGVRSVEPAMEFATVPKGCFEMGSPPKDEAHYSDEVPMHRVCLNSFEMARYSVTQGEWRKVMAHNPEPAFYKGNDRRPVEMISWYDAKSFIGLLNFFGRHRYRLATESEYEYAARGGMPTSRYWGEDTDLSCQHENIGDIDYKAYKAYHVDANCHDGFTFTAPVGSFPPNPYGLYDILGNVVSWTEDCMHDDYQGAPTDGSAWTQGICEKRVVRGAAYDYSPGDVRAANRSWYAPGDHFYDLGLRIVRVQ